MGEKRRRNLARGWGRLAGALTVEVQADDGTRRTLQARRAVVLATRPRAAYPPIDGLDTVGAWDNRDITTTDRVPDRLVVLGGGVVGAEMAQAFKRLGAAEVTIVELFDRLLAFEEPFVGQELRAVFEAEGIRVLTEVETTAAARRDGEVRPTLAEGSEVMGDEVLMATGRGPGHRRRRAWADDHAVPRVAFTDPQVAAVRAHRTRGPRGRDDRGTLTHPLGGTAAGALHRTDTVGTAHLVIDAPRRLMVGTTFTGPGAGELLHAATIAIMRQVTLDQLWHAVPAFPTLGEVWLRLLEAERGF